MMEPSDRRVWSDEDFEQLSWHDNRIRSIRVRNPAEGYDFEVEFDHILEWMPRGKRYRFLLAPARLSFHDVTGGHVGFDLHYRQDLIILDIAREDIAGEAERREGVRRWRFTLTLEMQRAPIVIEASGFTQRLIGEPRECDGQTIDDD
ncbi:MAG: hypothetical protein KDC38_14155 [Planctomycetes bacterium]|nr:hypothetical protein [Planctomycetota bacterium]